MMNNMPIPNRLEDIMRARAQLLALGTSMPVTLHYTGAHAQAYRELGNAVRAFWLATVPRDYGWCVLNYAIEGYLGRCVPAKA